MRTTWPVTRWSTGRKRVSIGLSVALAVAAGVVAVGSTFIPTSAQAATGQIVGAGSGRCIDIAGGNSTSGVRPIIWDCHGGDNQRINYSSPGQMQVLGKCLDATNYGRSEGTAVVLWDCTGGANQQWRTNSNGSITGVDSGLCLDAAGAATAAGTLLQLWGCNGGSNQNWGGSAGSGGGSTGGGSTGGGSSGRGIHVEGKYLVDGNGERVVMRGVEHVIRWGEYSGSVAFGDVPWEGGDHDADGSEIAQIARTGANSIRILGGYPWELENLLYKAVIQQDMWVSVARVNWADPTTVAVLKKYEKYITLHVKGETISTDENVWKNEAIRDITQIRNRGINAPIEIYTTGYGQHLQTVLNRGNEVAAADPQKNVVFGFQLYSELAPDVNGTLNKVSNFGHPIYVGAALFKGGADQGWGNTYNTYKEVWDGTADRGLPAWLWAWSGDGEGNNMSSSGSYDNLTDVGRYISRDSRQALSKNSYKSSFIRNASV